MKKKQVTNLKLLGYLMDSYSQVRYIEIFFGLLEFVGSLKMLLLSHEAVPMTNELARQPLKSGLHQQVFFSNFSCMFLKTNNFFQFEF